MSLFKIKKTVLYCLYGILLVSNCSHESPRYWPSKDIGFQNVTWEIPISDSLKVFIKEKGCWVLPEPGEECSAETTFTRHRVPLINAYKKYLGRVDQEVVHEYDSGHVEFYRFDGDLYLLGYTSPDSSRALTFFNPPLLILPNSIQSIPSAYESSGVTQVLNKISGQTETGQKSRVKLKVKEKGRVLLDSCETSALLCEMSLSMDGTVAFGETDLIVPDAVMLQNSMIIAEGVGPVLEWGIRLRKTGSDEIEPDRVEHERTLEESLLHKKRALYIEVTRHDIYKK